jgi:hypothetical protein
MGLSSVVSCTQCEAYANVSASHLAAVARTKMRISASVFLFFFYLLKKSHPQTCPQRIRMLITVYVCTRMYVYIYIYIYIYIMYTHVCVCVCVFVCVC